MIQASRQQWRGLMAFAVLALGVGLAGCAGTPKGYVAREWSATMRELGITPVFPPREDVQVGDIYMAPTTPANEAVLLEEKGFVPLGLWVATANLNDSLTEFYQSRRSFPATNKDGTGQPQAPDGDVFSGGDVKRLRLVGFPMFMSATLNRGSLSALVPVEAVSVAFGGAFSRARTINVSVPRAESYGLPAAQVYNILVPASTSPGTPKRWDPLAAGGIDASDIVVYLPNAQRDVLTKDTEWQKKKFGYVRVITEVFYARELDVSIDSGSARGAALEVQPVVSVPVPQLPPATNASTPAAPPATVAFKEATPQQIAAELNKQLDEAITARRTVGGGARFVAVGKRGVSLKVTFERPMAIGYRGVLLKVDQDGGVEGAGSLEAAVPTARP
jgi:hypothetical protein